MDNNDLANELRSMNQKLEVYYGEQEELHQRFTMRQGRLQRQEAELHSKDLALKDKEGQISELQRELERRTPVQTPSMLQQNLHTPSSRTGIKQEPGTPFASWYSKSGHCSLGSGGMLTGNGAYLPLETGPMQSFTASPSSGVPPFHFSTPNSLGGTSMHSELGNQSSP